MASTDHLTGSTDPLRVVFYSHDSQGLGHFRRNSALARAISDGVPRLAGRPVTGLLVNGVGGDGHSAPAGFDVVTLPAIGKDGGSYVPRHLGVGMGDVTSLRGEIVRATLESFAPDLVVVDRHALGVGGELTPALIALANRVPAAHLVLGLREVLDEPAAVAREWERLPLGLVRELFNEIWVYGDPTVSDLRVTGELPEELADLVSFTGYLSQGRAEGATGVDPETPYILTTVGGGSDGARLCHVAARSRVPAGHSHVVVTGPQMSEREYRAVAADAAPGTSVVRSVPDASGLIRRAAATISMAGYNTVCETLATDVPSLLVPREFPRTEQLIRARDLSHAGATDMLRATDVTEARVAAWLSQAVRTRTDRSHLDLAGLRNVASHAAEIANNPATANRLEARRVAS